MRSLIVTLALGLLSLSSVLANEPEFGLDSNTAFYEGEQYNYVMPPPNGFRMVSYLAKFDGYSFAFIPEDEFYDSASVIVGVHIYKIRGLSFDEALKADTSAIHQHYGSLVHLREIDPIKLAQGGAAEAFYFDSEAQFVPNIMIAYLANETELIIYELVIRPEAHKVPAEDRFIEAVSGIKALKRAELGQR